MTDHVGEVREPANAAGDVRSNPAFGTELALTLREVKLGGPALLAR